jgi:hypothetical protein
MCLNPNIAKLRKPHLRSLTESGSTFQLPTKKMQKFEIQGFHGAENLDFGFMGYGGCLVLGYQCFRGTDHLHTSILKVEVAYSSRTLKLVGL